MENKTYTLIEPITYGSEVITELTFKPLKAKHLRGLTGKSGMDDNFEIISRITGLSPQHIDEMGAEDAFEVSKIVNGFLGLGQKTGQAPTQP